VPPAAGVVQLTDSGRVAETMTSLRRSMYDKALPPLRVDRIPPATWELDVRTTQGDRAHQRPVSLPAWMLHLAVPFIDAARTDFS
jgi:hypothetical protein